MMLRQIERLRRCRRLDEIVVATSVEPSDDAIAELCRSAGIAVWRGSLDDVLDRYHAAATAMPGLAHVVRLTADCPLADWRVIDACVALHLERVADYTSNSVERSFPKGLDAEVVALGTLHRAWLEAKDPYEREHVTPYIYRNPDRFTIASLVDRRDRSAWRWTVDTPEDFEVIEAIYGALLPLDQNFASEAIEAFLVAHPEIARLNRALG
jgi:spore coat polysaccharide biosynthesis protein SpsF